MAAHIILAWKQLGLAELEKQGHLGARKPAAPAPGLMRRPGNSSGLSFPSHENGRVGQDQRL